jgi:hypothetical protein
MYQRAEMLRGIGIDFLLQMLKHVKSMVSNICLTYLYNVSQNTGIPAVLLKLTQEPKILATYHTQLKVMILSSCV